MNGKKEIYRNLSIIAQKNNLQGWKEDSIVRYGQRWIVDRNCFLLYKENVWKYVYTVKLKNMIQEMMLKTSLYNKMISVLTKRVIK